MSGFIKIGEYTPGTEENEEVIEREYYGQGLIVKDEEAFLNYPDKVCYIPELSEGRYTRNDFLAFCDGQEELARECFYAVDWQHPETWVEEQFVNDEWGQCCTCNYFYARHSDPKPCRKCGGILEYEWGLVSRDGITKVTSEMLRLIIENRQPLGLFYALENGEYTAVDNRNGDAWTETFPDLRHCKRWLLNPNLTAGGDEI